MSHNFTQHVMQPIETRCHCSCGGQFIATGKVFTSSPARYEHKCSKCREVELFSKPYPDLRHVEVLPPNPAVEAMREIQKRHDDEDTYRDEQRERE